MAISSCEAASGRQMAAAVAMASFSEVKDSMQTASLVTDVL